MVIKNRLKIPDIIINLIKLVIYTFYCDLHIITFELLLKIGYASEYGIAKEINVNIEKIRLITNSLYSENFIKYEDRLFKQMKICTIKNKHTISKRVYKLRYWYIDSNSIVWGVNEKIKNIFLKCEKKSSDSKDIFFKCPRKICGKKYSMSDLTALPFNYNTGMFSCNRFLNLKVICGSELQEAEILTDQNDKNKNIHIIRNEYEYLRIIVEMLTKINHLLKFEK
jgi:transcription initiation factor IIE alpha subunit